MTVVAAQRADKVPAALRGAEGAPRTALVPQEGGAIAEKLFLCAAGDRPAEELFEPFRGPPRTRTGPRSATCASRGSWCRTRR